MKPVWGTLTTDNVTKTEWMCDKCQLICPYMGDKDYYFGCLCCADYVIKLCYSYGNPHDAIKLLRGLPSELLKDYFPEERRTPTELKAVILDELQQREKEETMRL